MKVPQVVMYEHRLASLAAVQSSTTAALPAPAAGTHFIYHESSFAGANYTPSLQPLRFPPLMSRRRPPRPQRLHHEQI